MASLPFDQATEERRTDHTVDSLRRADIHKKKLTDQKRSTTQRQNFKHRPKKKVTSTCTR
jgi:hypothetical protein